MKVDSNIYLNDQDLKPCIPKQKLAEIPADISDKDTKKMPFVFWGSDWQGHPTSSIHIAKGLVQLGYKVHWVNSIGMRSPEFKLKDIKRISTKLLSFFKHKPSNPIASSERDIPISQLNPFVLPFYGSKLFRRINKILLGKQLDKFLSAVDSPFILVTTFPNTCDIVDFGNPAKKIYYVMDDFSTFPGVDNKVMLKLEERLLERMDGVLFASEIVQQKYVKKAKVPLPHELLTHGVDIAHFRTTFDSSLPIPQGFVEKTGPFIGFFGLIDERIDLELIRKTAEAFPEATIILLGKNTISMNKLDGVDNIVRKGAIPYPNLPEYLNIFDVCIMPYAIGEATRDINPLKLKEYLAAGKKVVSMKIPAVKAIDSVVFTANNHEEFIDKIHLALKTKADSQAISELIGKESWIDKSKQLVAFTKRLLYSQ